MNCREFEVIVNVLARARHDLQPGPQQGIKLIDATTLALGLTHVEVCERCARRLADEHTLSAGLKSLAASDEGRGAPDNVETALLEAFSAQRTNPIARHSSIQLRSWSRSWSRWALAAAAAILIALGFMVYRAVQNE